MEGLTEFAGFESPLFQQGWSPSNVMPSLKVYTVSCCFFNANSSELLAKGVSD